MKIIKLSYYKKSVYACHKHNVFRAFSLISFYFLFLASATAVFSQLSAPAESRKIPVNPRWWWIVRWGRVGNIELGWD